MKKAYFLGLGLLIVWVIFSNQFFILISGANKPKNFIWDTNLYKDTVYCSLETLQNMNNITEECWLAGYAFVGTNDDNLNRYASLILKGKSNCYEMRFSNYSVRSDIATIFSDKIYQDTAACFSDRFTFIDVKDGIYDIYIYCWENDTNHGLAHSGQQFIKHGNSMFLVKWQSSLMDDNFKYFEYEQNRSGLESLVLNKDGLNISGWVWVRDLNCANQNVYIELKDEMGNTMQYSTRNRVREDVAQAYNNLLYTMSGYSALISADEVADGTYTMKILVENEGKVWTSVPYKIIKTEKEVELEA